MQRTKLLWKRRKTERASACASAEALAFQLGRERRAPEKAPVWRQNLQTRKPANQTVTAARPAPETVLCLFCSSQPTRAAPPTRRPEASSRRTPTRRFLLWRARARSPAHLPYKSSAPCPGRVPATTSLPHHPGTASQNHHPTSISRNLTPTSPARAVCKEGAMIAVMNVPKMDEAPFRSEPL